MYNVKLSKWKLLRIGIPLLMLLVSFTTVESANEPEFLSSATFLLLYFFSAFGLLLVLYLQKINPLQTEQWLRPDWNCNPLQIKQPVQFFHFMAYFMMADGIGKLAGSLIYHIEFGNTVLLPFVVGAGLYTGVHLSMAFLSSKFVEK